jgi:pimeloyl-ACP methyl ester carboxylesterase
MLHSPILINCPVRLIHGEKDEDVPVGVAFKLLDSIHSADVQLTVIKQGGHRLSRPHEIEALMRIVAALAERPS